jgi:hypothetical protein
MLLNTVLPNIDGATMLRSLRAENPYPQIWAAGAWQIRRYGNAGYFDHGRWVHPYQVWATTSHPTHLASLLDSYRLLRLYRV